MDVEEGLLLARDGRATFTTDLLLTKLGHAGYWEMERIGERPCKPYVAHGNFNVDREAVYRSRLTEKGERLLDALKTTEHRGEVRI